MSVYIEGMNMPENGSCIQIVIDDDGKVYPSVEKCILKMGSIAKAVSVPPHGRMIDADNIGLTNFEIILCQKGNPYKNALEMLLKKIENAPTIIQAEPGEECET